MNVQDVVARVDAVYRYRSDDETAHQVEDDLYVDVLKAIAAGQCEDPSGCAAAALKTQDICFARWYA